MGVDKEPTTALQGGISHGKTVVGIWNLHVRITREDQQWFAQGFEIDYAACGTSQEDVKKKFQDGMAATIHEHLKLFGTIEGFSYPGSGCRMARTEENSRETADVYPDRNT